MAMDYYRSSIPESRAGNNDEMLCEAMLGMATLFKKLGNTDSALFYANNSLYIAKRNGFIKRIINAAIFLSAYFKSVGLIDSAYPYQEITIALKDSIFSQEKTREVQNLIFSEQLRQQNIEENNRKFIEKRKRNMQIIGIASFIPLFFGILLILSKRKIKPIIVELFGLLGLLLLFEFISLFIHPYIEIWTHETPIYMLLILVCIAALLVPLHHKLAQWVKERLAHKKINTQQQTVADIPADTDGHNLEH